MKRPSIDDPRPARGPTRESPPEQEDPSTRLVDLSAYYGHLACFRDLRPLMVKTNRFTYAPSYRPHDQMQNTWLSIALEGIQTLCAAESPRTTWTNVAVIGTGNGLDAVGISRMIRPQRIVASDIHPRVLDSARWNIGRYVGGGCAVTVRLSDLFGDYPASEAFDLIYENLPNVPDGTELFEGVRSASCYAPREHDACPPWDRHLLTLHHEFLIQARARLRDPGWIVCVIGGRIPADVIHEMFHEAGYRSLVAGFGLKIQSEAGVVVPAYADAEREHGSTFAYYAPLDSCIAIAREMPQPAELAAREAYAAAFTERLGPCRISATQAMREHEAGHPVCHTVYVVAGRLDLKDPEPTDA